MPNKATFFAPGKLFIAGEYAVVNGLAHALLVPTSVGITVQVRKTKHMHIRNIQYPNLSQSFTWISEIKQPLIRLSFEVLRQYLGEQQMELLPCSIKIKSSISSQHVKYGLGSSGALVVACLGALLKFYGWKLSPLDLYKLSVRAMIDHQLSSSFADLAVSSFKRPLLYHKFNKDIQTQIKTLSVQNTLALSWDGLVIQPVKDHELFHPLVVFSGVPAASSDFVSQVLPHITLADGQVLNDIVVHYRTQPIRTTITRAKEWLLDVENKSQQKLFVAPIQTVLSVAEQHAGFGKFSGAGGGDCVLVYFDQVSQEKLFRKKIKGRFQVMEGII
jgi:phosphomevalonate kinase